MSGYLGSLFREKGSKMALYYAQKTQKSAGSFIEYVDL